MWSSLFSMWNIFSSRAKFSQLPSVNSWNGLSRRATVILLLNIFRLLKPNESNRKTTFCIFAYVHGYVWSLKHPDLSAKARRFIRMSLCWQAYIDRSLPERSNQRCCQIALLDWGRLTSIQNFSGTCVFTLFRIGQQRSETLFLTKSWRFCFVLSGFSKKMVHLGWTGFNIL